LPVLTAAAGLRLAFTLSGKESRKTGDHAFHHFDELCALHMVGQRSQRRAGQLRWLRDTGFEDVDCYWRWLEMALLVGVKSERWPAAAVTRP